MNLTHGRIELDHWVGIGWRRQGVHEVRTGSKGMVIGSLGHVRAGFAKLYDPNQSGSAYIVVRHCGLAGSAKRGQDYRYARVVPFVYITRRTVYWKFHSQKFFGYFES
jgi:hypothetical protein